MKHITREQLYIKQYNLTNELFDEESIFFDIETTGFSPANSSIYLIGCLRKQGEQLIIDQFFAENKEDVVTEEAIAVDPNSVTNQH